MTYEGVACNSGRYSYCKVYVCERSKHAEVGCSTENVVSRESASSTSSVLNVSDCLWRFLTITGNCFNGSSVNLCTSGGIVVNSGQLNKFSMLRAKCSIRCVPRKMMLTRFHFFFKIYFSSIIQFRC